MILLKELLHEESPAAQQAKQMGLISKGWGRWADPKTGKVTHKTQGDRLVPLDPKQQEPGGGEPPRGQGPTSAPASPGDDEPSDDTLGQVAKDLKADEPSVDATKIEKALNKAEIGDNWGGVVSWQYDPDYGIVDGYDDEGGDFGSVKPLGNDTYLVRRPGEELGKGEKVNGIGAAAKILKSANVDTFDDEPSDDTSGQVAKDLKADEPSVDATKGDKKRAIKKAASVAKNHDWDYEYSDDHSVWQKGKESERALLKTLADSGLSREEADSMFDKLNLGHNFDDKMWSRVERMRQGGGSGRPTPDPKFGKITGLPSGDKIAKGGSLDKPKRRDPYKDISQFGDAPTGADYDKMADFDAHQSGAEKGLDLPDKGTADVDGQIVGSRHPNLALQKHLVSSFGFKKTGESDFSQAWTHPRTGVRVSMAAGPEPWVISKGGGGKEPFEILLRTKNPADVAKYLAQGKKSPRPEKPRGSEKARGAEKANKLKTVQKKLNKK